MKRVLMLGAGLVTGPLIDYMLRREDIALTIGTLLVDEAEEKIGGRPNGRAIELDVSDERVLHDAVSGADIVVSLVPWTFHPLVARQALDHGVPMLTASYISPEMRAFEQEAEEKGLLILNEVGLDPGLDHMSAMRVIDEIRDAGGRLTSFSSVCGGLPAPEAADPPWKYKFSWSPRGALLAARSAARYREGGIVTEIPGPELFRHTRPYPIKDLGMFECYPNRDSLQYLARYRIQDVETMFRGTLRWPGWSATMDVLARLDLLALEPRNPKAGDTFATLLDERLPGSGPIEPRLAAFAEIGDPSDVVTRIRAVGLLDEKPLPEEPTAPVDLLAERFSTHLQYHAHERDMVVQEHVFLSTNADGDRERRTSSLVTCGEPDGDSATARTVALPAAIAAIHMLEGRYSIHGVRAPVHREMYEPILKELETLGITFKETLEILD